jgi:hypothetical protein
MSTQDQYNYNYYLTMSIEDPAGTSIRSDYGNIYTSAVTFTHKLPSGIAGGEYTIKVVTSGGQVTPA